MDFCRNILWSSPPRLRTPCLRKPFWNPRNSWRTRPCRLGSGASLQSGGPDREGPSPGGAPSGLPPPPHLDPPGVGPARPSGRRPSPRGGVRGGAPDHCAVECQCPQEQIFRNPRRDQLTQGKLDLSTSLRYLTAATEKGLVVDPQLSNAYKEGLKVSHAAKNAIGLDWSLDQVLKLPTNASGQVLVDKSEDITNKMSKKGVVLPPFFLTLLSNMLTTGKATAAAAAGSKRSQIPAPTASASSGDVAGGARGRGGRGAGRGRGRKFGGASSAEEGPAAPANPPAKKAKKAAAA